MENKLIVKNLNFGYGNKKSKNVIIDNMNLVFKRGKVYGITGRSGTGKTTLLSLLGGLERPDGGEILYEGKSIEHIGLKKYRSEYVGFVFQHFNLLDYMSAVQNVKVSKEIAHSKKETDIYRLLDSLGITKKKADRNIQCLSGGEQQRVAIACAIAKDAEIILADEPTGNLDSLTAVEIFNILREIAHVKNKYVIIVTHSAEIAGLCDEEIKLSEE